MFGYVTAALNELTEAEKEILNGIFANKYGEDLKAAVNKAAESPNIADLIRRSEYAEQMEDGGKEN